MLLDFMIIVINLELFFFLNEIKPRKISFYGIDVWSGKSDGLPEERLTLRFWKAETFGRLVVVGERGLAFGKCEEWP